MRNVKSINGTPRTFYVHWDNQMYWTLSTGDKVHRIYVYDTESGREFRYLMTEHEFQLIFKGASRVDGIRYTKHDEGVFRVDRLERVEYRGEDYLQVHIS